VTLAWAPREAQLDATPVAARVDVIAESAAGVAFEGRVDAGGTSFAAASGPLGLAVTIYDKDGEVIDRNTVVVPVPDASARALALSTPVVYRARNPSELRAITAGPNAPVYAGRDFDRTDRMLVSFGTFGAFEGGRSTAVLMTRTGTKLADLPVQPDPRRGGYLIEVPLSSIARGEFVVSIEATRGDERAQALVAMRIVR
jgi:hypothetical protein